MALRKAAPVTLSFHWPTTEDGKQELAMRAAELHANAVIRRIQALSCSRRQKLALLDAIMEARKEETQQPVDPTTGCCAACQNS